MPPVFGWPAAAAAAGAWVAAAGAAVAAGGGALVFLESDPNPLITAKEVATTWYVSFSFDVDVGRIFR